MTLLKISTGECNLKELHEFKNNNNDGFKTFIATLTDWFLYKYIFHYKYVASAGIYFECG